ncbi:MAG TPA: M28 family peptidase [Gemmatimonadales bacterium]|nr:M28 family peptidase [Gemmatimonadales bacterium]
MKPRRLAILPVVLLAAGPLRAQTASSHAAGALAAAAATITGDDVMRRVGIIADDSMMGRDTPSRGLELTAKYVADQFRRFGLGPGGDSGTWFQRYPITRRQMQFGRSDVVFRAGRVTARAGLDRSARLVSGGVPDGPVEGPAIVLGGPLTPDAVGRMTLRDKVVLYVPDYRSPLPANSGQVARAIRVAGPRAIVSLANLDSVAFAARVPTRAPERYGLDIGTGAPPMLEVSEMTVAPVLRAAGIDLDRIRDAAEVVGRDVPALGVRVDLRDSVLSRITAPNTIGILPGADPKLRDEYLVFSAHMDHIGITPGQRDSINNGADDDGSGTTGVIELAEAFSRPGVRPARSILFITVSGEEKGLWGSRYFSEHPTVPLDHIVADLNIDMIGRNWRDTIVAIGKEHSDLGATLERVNAAHPELHMTAIDDRWPEERFYFRSDHYNFARKGVPILFFFNGVHADYHEVTDSPDKIDGEKESRILRLLFYLGQEIANAPTRPEWNPASRAEIVE